jgi:hypothetical protein
MLAISMSIYGPPSTEIYQQLAETYNLPTIGMLVASIDHDISWQCDPSTQVYYVDNLREQNRRNTFQIRFEVRPGMHDMIDVFVSLNEDNQTVHSLSIRFQPRGNRGCASKVLAWLKSAAHDGKEAEFEIQGFGERDGLRFIREHSLSAFQWHETLQRYLHVTDDIRAIKLPKNKQF